MSEECFAAVRFVFDDNDVWMVEISDGVQVSGFHGGKTFCDKIVENFLEFWKLEGIVLSEVNLGKVNLVKNCCGVIKVSLSECEFG
jgi:hypothetical protein